MESASFLIPETENHRGKSHQMVCKATGVCSGNCNTVCKSKKKKHEKSCESPIMYD